MIFLPFILGAYLFLFFMAQKWLTPGGALTVVVCSVAITSTTQHHKHFNLEMAIFLCMLFGALWALVYRKKPAFTVFMILALLTREDALILAPVGALSWILDRDESVGLYAAISTIVAFGIIRGISLAHLGHRPYYCPLFQISTNIRHVGHLLQTGNIFAPITSFFTTFFPLGIVVLWKHRCLPDLLKAYAYTFALYLLSAFVIAKLAEADHWYALLPLFVIPAVYILLPSLRTPDQRPET